MALAWERKRPPHKWHGKQQEADAHDAGGAEIHKKFVLGQSPAFIKSSIPLEGKQLPRRVAKRDKGLMLMMLAHIFRRR